MVEGAIARLTTHHNEPTPEQRRVGVPGDLVGHSLIVLNTNYKLVEHDGATYLVRKEDYGS